MTEPSTLARLRALWERENEGEAVDAWMLVCGDYGALLAVAEAAKAVSAQLARGWPHGEGRRCTSCALERDLVAALAALEEVEVDGPQHHA